MGEGAEADSETFWDKAMEFVEAHWTKALAILGIAAVWKFFFPAPKVSKPSFFTRLARESGFERHWKKIAATTGTIVLGTGAALACRSGATSNTRSNELRRSETKPSRKKLKHSKPKESSNTVLIASVAVGFVIVVGFIAFLCYYLCL